MKTLTLLLLPVIALSGCMTKSATKAIASLKDDPATLHVKVNGWGTVVEIFRSNPATNQPVSIDGDKINIGSEAR